MGSVYTGVVVFHRSIVDWRGGEVNLPWVYVPLLYMKLIWHNGFPEIYTRLEEAWGQSAMGIYEFCNI